MISAVSLFPLVSAVLNAVLMAVAIVAPAHLTRTTRFFVLLNATSFIWSVGYFLRLNVSPDIDPALAAPGSVAYWVLVLLVIGAAGTPTYWFLFGAAASGRERWTRGWALWAAHIPLALTLVAAMTNHWHHLFVAAQTGETVYGPLARTHHLAGLVMGTGGFLLFLGTLLRRPENNRADVLSFGLSAFVPYAGNLLWISRDFTQFASQALAVPVLQPLSNLILMVIVFRSGIAEIVPDGLLRSIMENTDTLLAYLNCDLEIVTANSAFVAKTRLNEGELVGRPIADVVHSEQLLGLLENARRSREAVEHRAWPDALAEAGIRETSYWNWSIKPVGGPRRLRGFVFSMANVTEEVREAAYSTTLGRLTQTLHADLDPEVDLPPVLAEAGRLLKADVCALVLGSEGDWRWVSVCEDGFEWQPFDPEEWSHFGIALSMKRPVVIDDAASESSGVGMRTLEAGIRRVLTLPLIARGEVMGAISFGSYAPGYYASAQVAFVHELAKTVVGALQTARKHGAERAIANILQDGLVSVPARVDGLEVATAYQSATVAARVGGDLYDLFEVEPGTVALVIADIAGKGIEAAALSSLLRGTLRSVALRYLSPGRILSVTNEVLRRQLEVGRFATVFVGLLDLENGLLRYSSAGHPGPFVLRREGRVERLDRNPGLLGVFEDMIYPCKEIVLERGDLVLMYTDGLIETRKALGSIEEDLVPFLAGLASHEPAEVVDAVIGHSTEECGGELKDDVAVMAVRLAKATTRAPHPADARDRSS